MTSRVVNPILVIFILSVLFRIYKTNGDRKFLEKYRVFSGVFDVDPQALGGTPNLKEVEQDTCPEIQMLDALVENFERTHEWDLVLRVGDMYARGCFPKYSPDDFSALKIYMAASKCPDPIVSCEALSRYVHLRRNPLSAEDRKGTPFPLDTSRRLVLCIESHLKDLPLSHYMRKRSPRDTTTGRITVSRVPGVGARDPRPPTTINNLETYTPTYALDSQNVHDHGVSTSIRQNIKAVLAEIGPEESGFTHDRQDVIESVMKVLRDTGMEEGDLNKAFRVIVSLVPDKISSVGCSQMDVLNATFKKISKVQDPKVRNNLFESLGKNLASGVERGHVVCSTGKIGRIIATLEGVEHEVLGPDGSKFQKSVPVDVVRTEISNLASKIRTDVLSEASSKQVEDYNKFPNSNLSEIMDSRFRNEVKKVYVDGLHLSEKVLDPIVEMYSSVF